MKRVFFFILCIQFVTPLISQDTELVLKKAFPDPNSMIEDDYLVYPYDLEMFEEFFIVCDVKDSCLKVFSKSGEYIRKIGKSGQKIPGHIFPQLTFKNGHIYALRKDESGYVRALRIKFAE